MMTTTPSRLAILLFAATGLSKGHLHYGGTTIATNVVTYTSYHQYAAIMLAAVNKQRATQGLAALCLNKKLHESAQAHSEDMAAHDYMGHVGSDGATMSERITHTGYDWKGVAENVAAGQVDVNEVMTAWINSPEHLENIMGDYTMFASGYAFNLGGSFQHYWTQHFGASDTEACDGLSYQTVPEVTAKAKPLLRTYETQVVTPAPMAILGTTAPVTETVTPAPMAILGTTAPATEAVTPAPMAILGTTAPVTEAVTPAPMAILGTTAPVTEAVTPAPMAILGTNAPVTEAPVMSTFTPTKGTKAVTPAPIEILGTKVPATECSVVSTPAPTSYHPKGKDCESAF